MLRRWWTLVSLVVLSSCGALMRQPAEKRETYSGLTPVAIAEGTKKLSPPTARVPVTGGIYIAPVVHTFEYVNRKPGAKNREYSARWAASPTSAGLQDVTWVVYKHLYDTLSQAGFPLVGTNDFEASPAAMQLGRAPDPYFDRHTQAHYGRPDWEPYTFVSKHKELRPSDMAALTLALQNLGGVVFPRVHSVWFPKTYASIDNENVINFQVLFNFELTVCSRAGVCGTVTAPAAKDQWLETAIPVPFRDPADKKKWDEVNDFAYALIGTQVGTILANAAKSIVVR